MNSFGILIAYFNYNLIDTKLSDFSHKTPYSLVLIQLIGEVVVFVYYLRVRLRVNSALLVLHSYCVLVVQDTSLLLRSTCIASCPPRLSGLPLSVPTRTSAAVP